MTAIKVIEVIGTSNDSWDDAVREAVDQANETISDIRGVDVIDWTAEVEDGSLTEYRATVHIAFPVRSGPE